MKQLIALLVLCSIGMAALAQENSYKPKAILIKLNTKTKAITHLKEKGLIAKADLLKIENDTLNARLIRDWKDHFDYCPVYFFADTNLNEVLEGRLSEVVYDAAWQTIPENQVQQIDAQFYIAYMGSRAQDDYAAAEAAPGATELPVLNVMDARMQPLSSYQLSSSMNGDLVSFLFPRRDEAKYRFRSRYFKLDYFPVAAKYQKKLRNYWEE